MIFLLFHVDWINNLLEKSVILESIPVKHLTDRVFVM